MPTIENIDKISLVINGGFEDGEAGWTVTGGLQVEADEEHMDAFSAGCLRVQFERGTAEDGGPDGEPGTISQALAPELVKTITSRGLSFQVRVACDTPGALFAFLSEDGGTTKQYGRGNGEGGAILGYEGLRADGFALTSKAASVVFGVEVRKSCQAYLDCASLVMGSAAADYQSCITSEMLKYLVGGSAGSAEAADYAPTGRDAASSGVPSTTYGGRITADPKPPTFRPDQPLPEMVSPQGAPLLPHPGVSVPMPPEPRPEPEPRPSQEPRPEQVDDDDEGEAKTPSRQAGRQAARANEQAERQAARANEQAERERQAGQGESGRRTPTAD